MLRNFVAFLSIWTMTMPSFAEFKESFPQKSVCYQGSKIAVYINGVNKSDEQQVVFSARNLLSRLNANGVDIEKVAYMHNPSESLFLDLATEAIFQKLADSGLNGLAFIDKFASEYVRFGLQTLDLLPADELPKDVRMQRMLELKIKFDEFFLTPVGEDLLDQFSDSIQTTLDSSNKVVIVSHSQGNFIANSIYARMQVNNPTWVNKNLSIVNVANPTTQAPSGLNFSSDGDLIIKLAPDRFGDGEFVDMNISRALDSTGHGFSEIYLSQKLKTLDGVPMDQILSQLVLEAFEQGKDVPRCCGDDPARAHRWDVLINTRTPVHYRLSSSSEQGVSAEGERGANFRFLNRNSYINNSWEIEGLDLYGSAQTPLTIFSVRMTFADYQLPLHPVTYVFNEGVWGYFIFTEPTETFGDGGIGVDILASPISPLYLDITKVEPFCIDYDGIDANGHGVVYDRTSAPTARLRALLYGEMSYTAVSYPDLLCRTNPPTQTHCRNPDNFVYDTVQMDMVLNQSPAEFIVNPRTLDIGSESYP